MGLCGFSETSRHGGFELSHALRCLLLRLLRLGLTLSQCGPGLFELKMGFFGGLLSLLGLFGGSLDLKGGGLGPFVGLAGQLLG